MKYLLVMFIFLGLISCSSTTTKDADSKGQKDKKFQSQVMVEGEDGVLRPVNSSGSKEKLMYDMKTRKPTKSGGWIELNGASRPGKFLTSKSVRELLVLARSSSPRESTLIIDELLVRKKSSVPALMTFLDDKRPASFEKNRNYWWYEKKGQEPEVVEIRLYALYAVQNKISERPQGMTIILTKDKMFYGLKDGFAVVKDDAVKLWKVWWEQAKNDY